MHLLRFSVINEIFSLILRNNFFYEVQIIYCTDSFDVGDRLR